MPTECERSSSPPNAGVPIDTIQTTQQTDPKTVSNIMDTERSDEMATSTNGHNDTCSTSGRKLSITSADPTAYVAKARITRPAPPPPSYNPMQFVQIKPCNLYQTAQQQLKKAEEVKKIKEIKKEEPEDWQNNLDNWKSSRRKRVEHIIDRVVEVKKLELEEFDRSRRKSKTFSEMIEERGERGVRVGRAKLASLAVYNEDESNDLSDLGIGTSSASGKSSLSEDYDNNSVMSDGADLEKAILENNHPQNCSTREYVSSPGYDTSSSTAPASSPDPCEYTYEGAIQDYKQRVSRATLGGSAGFQLNSNKGEYKLTMNEPAAERGTDEPTTFEGYPARRGSKIEERLIGFEVNSPNDSQDLLEKSKIDLPKINISKRKEIFENAASKSNNNHQQVTTGSTEPKSHSCNGVPKVTLRENFKLDGAIPTTVQTEGRRLSGDITSIKDRLLSLEQQQNVVKPTKDIAKAPTAKVTVDIPVLPLKDRLSSLHNAATKEEIKKPPVLLIDARQLEIMKDEEEHAKQRMKQTDVPKTLGTRSQHLSSEEITTESPGDKLVVKNKEAETDRDDSGIHTSDDIDDQEERNMKPDLLQETPEQQLNEAIAALAIEEQQLQQAANAVNQIEAEFAELSDTTNMAAVMKSASSAGGDEQPCEMDFSVSSTNDYLKKSRDVGRSSCSCDDSSGNLSDSVNNVNVDKEVLGSINSGSSLDMATCTLNRKASNEMVHARNLLNIFKETFKNDIELDEEDHEIDVAQINSVAQSTSSQIVLSSETYASKTPNVSLSPKHSSKAITTQIFESSRKTPVCSKDTTCVHLKTLPPSGVQTKSTGASSMIPRSVGPTGKPPMSPKLSRPLVRSPQPPPSVPTTTHKSDNQFSINGRVEIFNSKNIQPSVQSSNSPTSPHKKSCLPHLTTITNGKQGTTAPNELCVDSSQSVATAKSMPPKSAREPNYSMRPSDVSLSASHSASPQQETEIIVCAPPVTVVNPDELPKPNTVKALTSCFSNDHCEKTRPAIPPKPSPRSRTGLTPPQSPKPRQVLNDKQGKPGSKRQDPSPDNLSINSRSSTLSSGSTNPSQPLLVATTALIHSPPLETQNCVLASKPSEIPPLIICTPNESTLYKLASSAPQSPASPALLQQLSPIDADFCKSFFSNTAEASAQPPQSSPVPLIRQQTVEDVLCNKIDVRKLPPSQVPSTGCFDVTQVQIKSCDNPGWDSAIVPANKPEALDRTAPNSKPNSPIMVARAAHSKALIETCEKIIAEERQTRSQIKNASLPPTPTSHRGTPILERKSKIPKAIPCCISGSSSMSKADLEQAKHGSTPLTEYEKDDDDLHHIMETQIKVTTTTPPASPKVVNRTHPNSGNNSANNSKPKTKNIFDFLKRNFGHNSEDEPSSASTQASEPVADTVKVDKIITVENSKFYIASDEDTLPPLPMSAPPVNKEATVQKLPTNEVLEVTDSDEINALLDDEINKLSLESGEAAGKLSKSEVEEGSLLGRRPPQKSSS